MGFLSKMKEALTGASVEGTVRDLGMASENRTLDQILEMADLVVTITERLFDVVKFYCADACQAMERAAGELDALESQADRMKAVSYTHLRAHETVLDLVCRL